MGVESETTCDNVEVVCGRRRDMEETLNINESPKAAATTALLSIC